MNNLLVTKFTVTNKKTVRILLMGMVVFVSLILAQDFIRASVNGSAFYFPESIMFSAFWWIFAPLLLAQYTLIKHSTTRNINFQGLAIALPVMLHLVMFPLLVWVLSSTFYYHTFAIQQTLRYALSEHLYQVLMIYATPVLVYSYYVKKANPDENPVTTARKDSASPSIHALLVSDGDKKRTIPLQEIVYFSALSPYISIHTDERKYLYTETLKSIATRLPAQQFVRVHKSTIVNINRVACYSSRLNGDYDLILKNKATLRVSRNFAAEFKQRFQERHQHTTE